MDAHYLTVKDGKFLEKVEQLLTYLILAEIQQIQYEIDSLGLIGSNGTFIQFSFDFSIKIVPIFWAMEIGKISLEISSAVKDANNISLIRKSEVLNQSYLEILETKSQLIECIQNLSNADG